ncbi:MAG TPA: Arc family DNA-binding protein [Marmoricola sp.]|jgi:hypothetical protein
MRKRPGLVAITIRLPDATHAKLQEAAGEDMRSMNAELVWLLNEALERRAAARQRAEQQGTNDDQPR